MDAALSEVYSFQYSMDEEELHEELRQNVERLAAFGPKIVEKVAPWLNITGAPDALGESDMPAIVAHGVMMRLGQRGIPEVCRLALSDETPLAVRSALVRHLLDYEGHPDARAALGRLAGSPDPKVREMVDRQKRVKAAVDVGARIRETPH